MPDVLEQGADRAADRSGDGMPDREEPVDAARAQAAQVGQECLRASGAVGADEDGGAVAVGVGDLGQGLLENGDVIGSRVGPGVAWPQHSGQGSFGVVQEAQQRVVAEAAFIGGRRLLLLGVAGDECGVDAQDQVREVASARVGRGYPRAGVGGLYPGDFAGGGAGRLQCREGGRVGSRPAAPRRSEWWPPDRTPRPDRAVEPGP